MGAGRGLILRGDLSKALRTASLVSRPAAMRAAPARCVAATALTQGGGKHT